VVSGVNQGANLAQDVTYSGTVTAAMEAVIFGVPAIAVSLDSHTDPIFDEAAAFAAKLAPEVVKRGLPEMTLLNVNVPFGKINGVKVTRQGHRIYLDELVERADPMNKPYYWIGGERPSGQTEEVGTDVWAVAQGYISVTPIHLDMTDHAYLKDLEAWNFQE
jgi:5'/3'-nucleotidase